ncbi:MAG TPA: hypothetical protein VFO55_15085 [Gemmatimonadaceae bacterium]|nr:hypothetical protein [Gemmatimonadaceae bacterium]
MRSSRTLFALTLLCAFSTVAGAQDGRVWPAKRAFLVLGEGLATGGGGLLNNGTSIMHAMRVGAVARITGTHGVDFTAVRLQTIIPPSSRLNDTEYANPEGDALILSYASLNRTRAGGMPNELALGGGIIRRQTSEAGRTRDTWVVRIGYDADPFARWSEHFDSGIGFQAYLMESRGNSLVYVASLGLYLRIG